MPLRLALAVFGLVELLFPRAVVDFGMRHMTDDAASVELRPWVYTVARLEGLVILLWALRSGRKKSSAA